MKWKSVLGVCALGLPVLGIETGVTARIAIAPSSAFQGSWQAERCVDASPDRTPSERLRAEREMMELTGSLTIGEHYFTSEQVPDPIPAGFLKTRISSQAYSVDGGEGNRVVIVVLYQRNILGSAASEVPMISSSIRDYELQRNGKLIERRRGITYQMTSSNPTELLSGIYEAYCIFNPRESR